MKTMIFARKKSIIDTIYSIHMKSNDKHLVKSIKQFNQNKCKNSKN